jgi:ABC-2 type transport system permease protein
LRTPELYVQGTYVFGTRVQLAVFFLSGALYSRDLAPPWIRFAAAYDPAAYGVDSMRGVLTRQFAIDPGRSFATLAACLICAGSLVMLQLSRRNVKSHLGIDPTLYSRPM